MNFGSCKGCGKGIMYNGLSLCKDCEEKYLHSVKEFIYDNGVKSAQEIHQATNVPVQVILYFLNHDCLSQSVGNSEDILQKNLNEQERLRKKQLIDALARSFKEKAHVDSEQDNEYQYQGEMHFLGRDKRR